MPEDTPGFRRIGDDLTDVRRRLEQWTESVQTSLRPPLELYIRNSGRLLRPTLALTSAYVTNPDTEGKALIDTAACCEMLHVATLHHDGICDGADLRRGAPSVNSRFGDPVALISGDYLLTTAWAQLSRVGGGIPGLLADALREVSLGQLAEFRDQHDPYRTEAAYYEAASGKTAALMAACTRAGAAVAGAADEDQKHMERYGHGIGMAFQIWDDLLDIWAPPGATGKSPGQDVVNGIYTLPVIQAVAEAPERVVPLLAASRTGFRPELRRALDDMGVRERSVAVAGGFVAEALDELESLTEPAVTRINLLVDTGRTLFPEAAELFTHKAREAGSRGRVKTATPLERAASSFGLALKDETRGPR